MAPWIHTNSLRSKIISILRGYSSKSKMELENLSLVYHNSNNIDLEVRPIPKPKENGQYRIVYEPINKPPYEINIYEVLIAVEYNCISPAEFQRWLLARSISKNKKSVVIGTSATGEVLLTAGSQLRVGDRVVVEPGVCCMKCRFCLSGRTNLCPHIEYVGTERRDGGLAQYIAHPAQFTHKLPTKVPLATGTLLPRIAVAVHCYERAQINSQSIVLIFGSGITGLLTLMIFKILGVGALFVAEESNYRLELAKELGADYAIKLAPFLSPEYPEYLNQILSATKHQSADVTVITETSQDYILPNSSSLTISGGKVLLGGFMSTPKLGPQRGPSREIDILESVSYTRESFQKALKIIEEKTNVFDAFVAHQLHLPLSKAIDAFNYGRATSRENISILIGNNLKTDTTREETTAVIENANNKPINIQIKYGKESSSDQESKQGQEDIRQKELGNTQKSNTATIDEQKSKTEMSEKQKHDKKVKETTFDKSFERTHEQQIKQKPEVKLESGEKSPQPQSENGVKKDTERNKEKKISRKDKKDNSTNGNKKDDED